MKAGSNFVQEFRYGSSTRTLVLLHGTGRNEHDLISLGREVDPAAGILSPRGKVLENGMPRFFRRLAEGVFDEEDLKKNTYELATSSVRQRSITNSRLIRSLHSVIRTAQTSPLACCYFDPKRFVRPCYFGQWYRSYPKKCRISPLCAYGSAPGTRIQ